MLVVTPSCKLLLTSQATYIYVLPYKTIDQMHTNRYHPYEKLYNECMIGVEWKQLSRMRRRSLPSIINGTNTA